MLPSRHIGVVIIVGLAVLLLAFGGVFRSLDGWFFDRLVGLSPSQTVSSQSVLVAVSQRELEVSEIIALAERLHRNGARAAVFARQSPEPLDVRTSLLLSEWKAGVTPGWRGPASPPPGGIWRGAGPEEETAPLLQPAVADLVGLPSPWNNSYLDFRVRRDGFQRIEVGRLLEGDLPRSLVEGKVVLVGRDSPEEALITTPLHRGSEALSPLLFLAAMIDASERKGMIRLASTPVQWSIAFALAALLALLLGFRRRTSALWLTVCAAVLAVAAAWVLLWQFQWWLPPAKTIALLGAAGSTAAVSRTASQRTTLRRTLRNLAVNAQERADKGRFLTGTSPWPQVEAALSHSFAFKPSFFLRLNPSAGTLEAVTEQGVEACRSFFADGSLRRDHEPFATAQRGSAAVLGDGLVILPLGSAARLFGFWVFKPEDETVSEQASSYAERLAAMLENRESWRERARPHQLHGNKEATLRVRPLHDQLEGSFELLDGGRKLLAEALDRSMEAVLAYDPFGDLIHLSSRAVDLLGSAGINYAEAPPADLLASLTAADPAQIRRTLRFVALHDEDAAFKATADLIPGREFLVHIRCLREAALAGLDTGPGLPGILVLIQDVTQTARAVLLKDEFMERIYFQLNNDFEAVLAASALLDDPRVDADERAELLSVITEKIEEAAGRMKDTRAHFGTEFSPEAVERYPVSFGPVFDAAQAAVAAELETHQVTIDTSISEYIQLVLAAPKPLEDLLHAILLTLIHDSREESRLTIAAAQHELDLHITLKNAGFGMPQEKLERYLQEGADRNETLERIGAGIRTVQAWGGTLRVRSEVGSGLTCELNLVSVI